MMAGIADLIYCTIWILSEIFTLVAGVNLQLTCKQTSCVREKMLFYFNEHSFILLVNS